MESNETEDIKPYNLETDVCSKLEALLKSRNKITRHKEVILPCAYSDDIDLSDILDEIPQVSPHKRLQDNENLVNLAMEDIRKLKHTSELEMNFNIDEDKNLDDEINQTILRLRQQTEKLFKRIINSQVGFNDCLNSNLLKDDLGSKKNILTHSKLIEETCKLDRGLESVISCNKDTLKKNIERDLKIENEEELKKVSKEMTQGVLSTVFENGKKTFKNHEHFLAIKQFNKSTGGLIVENMISGTLDPYTRQEITKPVRNKVCKHVYDEKSVDKIFQGKCFASCPYIGCTNKHFTKKDLLYNLNTSNNSE